MWQSKIEDSLNIAKRDIIVYKLLCQEGNKYKAFYDNDIRVKMVKGKKYRTYKLRTCIKKSFDKVPYLCVRGGYESFVSHYDIIDSIMNSSIHKSIAKEIINNGIICKCVIREGSKYATNEYGQIISSDLELVEPYLKIVETSALKYLNVCVGEVLTHRIQSS